jgi:hypothetical protein
MNPIAFIDDHRPGEHPQSALQGLITVTSPSSQKLASGLPSTLAIPKGEADAKRKTANVTEIFWSDGHVEWTLRCLECARQVQMHRDTIRAIADGLAESLDHWPLVPIPDSDEPERHMVPLRVLCTMVAHQNM